MNTNYQTKYDLRVQLKNLAVAAREALASDDPREWAEMLESIATEAEMTLAQRVTRSEPDLWECCDVPKAIGHAAKCPSGRKLKAR